MNIRKWFRDLFTRITSRPIPPQIPTTHATEVRLALEGRPRPIVIPRKKKSLKFCPVMSKNMYTREKAKSECDRLSTKQKPLRFYLCEHCNTWHLTHKKNGYGR